MPYLSGEARPAGRSPRREKLVLAPAGNRGEVRGAGQGQGELCQQAPPAPPCPGLPASACPLLHEGRSLCWQLQWCWAGGPCQAAGGEAGVLVRCLTCCKGREWVQDPPGIPPSSLEPAPAQPGQGKTPPALHGHGLFQLKVRERGLSAASMAPGAARVALEQRGRQCWSLLLQGGVSYPASGARNSPGEPQEEPHDGWGAWTALPSPPTPVLPGARIPAPCPEGSLGQASWTQAPAAPCGCCPGQGALGGLILLAGAAWPGKQRSTGSREGKERGRAGSWGAGTGQS